MVFPIADDNSDLRITPYVNYALIALNIFVFVFLQQLASDVKFTYAFSTVPLEIITGKDVVTASKVLVEPMTGQHVLLPGLQPTPVSVYLTLIVSMFMHGGFAHIFGNMFFLYVFGDNVEDRMGHFRYLLFYLLCGIIASLAHVYTTALFASDPSSLLIPSLGASGAISGVLGAYLVLHPRRRVTIMQFFFLADVPAYIAIGIWFALQLISGLGLLGGGSQQGGVAYAAHIGGFIAGLVLVKLFTMGRGRPTFSRPF